MEKPGRKLNMVSLTVPIFIEQFLRYLMNFVSTFMLSRISDDASAAVGTANQIITVAISVSGMFAASAGVVVSQLIGAGRDEEAGVATMNSLTISALTGAFMSTLVISFAGPLVSLMGLKGILMEHAVSYLRTAGIICFIQFFSSMTAQHFRCRGKTRIPMFVIIINNLVNILGSWLVTEGMLPVSGVTGVALVRVVSESTGLVILLLFFMRERWWVSLKDLYRIRKKYLGQILGMGIMAGMESLSFNLSPIVTTRFIASLPSYVLSAKVYTQSVNTYAYMAGWAVGQSTQIAAGHMIGAGKREEAFSFIKKVWLAIFILDVSFAGIFFLFSDNMIGWFTDSSEILALAHILFMIDWISCAGRPLNHSFNFGLRSAGFVFWPMVTANVSIWITAVGLGYVLSVKAGLGVIGLWAAQAVDEWIRGLFSAWFWLRKKWYDTRLV